MSLLFKFKEAPQPETCLNRLNFKNVVEYNKAVNNIRLENSEKNKAEKDRIAKLYKSEVKKLEKARIDIIDKFAKKYNVKKSFLILILGDAKEVEKIEE